MANTVNNRWPDMDLKQSDGEYTYIICSFFPLMLDIMPGYRVYRLCIMKGVLFMSFIISVHVKEGIVLASDSRTTYTKTEKNGDTTTVKIGTHITDTTNKTFLCPNQIGIATCGEASLAGTPITGYIEEFIREKLTDSTDVADVPSMLIDYFQTTPAVPNANFIVMGYHTVNNIKSQCGFWLNVKRKTITPIDTTSAGARWDGETKTLSKIIQNTYMRDKEGKEIALGATEVAWNLLTLQDAIDFAQYAVDITIKTMHYSNVVETVGGPIDILVIKPDCAFWIQHKDLHA